MSIKNVEKFLNLVKSNENLQKELILINEKLQKEEGNEEKIIADNVVPLAKKNGIIFTADDFLQYANEQMSALSEEDLLNVSGGANAKRTAVACLFAGITALSFAAPAVQEFLSGQPTSSALGGSETKSSGKDSRNNQDEVKTGARHDNKSRTYRKTKVEKENNNENEAQPGKNVAHNDNEASKTNDAEQKNRRDVMQNKNVVLPNNNAKNTPAAPQINVTPQANAAKPAAKNNVAQLQAKNNASTIASGAVGPPKHDEYVGGSISDYVPFSRLAISVATQVEHLVNFLRSLPRTSNGLLDLRYVSEATRAQLEADIIHVAKQLRLQNNDYNEKEIIMQGGINPDQKIARENAEMLLGLGRDILTSQRVTPGLVLEAIKDNILPSDETQGLPDLDGSDAIISGAVKTALLNLTDEQINSTDNGISAKDRKMLMDLRQIASGKRIYGTWGILDLSVTSRGNHVIKFLNSLPRIENNLPDLNCVSDETRPLLENNIIHVAKQFRLQNNDYNEKEIIMQGGINPEQKIARENADMLLTLAENILTSKRVTPALVLEAIKDNILPSDETQGLPDLDGSDAIISGAVKTALLNLTDEQINSTDNGISAKDRKMLMDLRQIASGKRIYGTWGILDLSVTSRGNHVIKFLNSLPRIENNLPDLNCVSDETRPLLENNIIHVAKQLRFDPNDPVKVIMQGGINSDQKIARENADTLLTLAENILTSQRVTPGLVLEAIKDNILPSDETQGLPDLDASDAIISGAVKAALLNLTDEQINSSDISAKDRKMLMDLRQIASGKRIYETWGMLDRSVTSQENHVIKFLNSLPRIENNLPDLNCVSDETRPLLENNIIHVAKQLRLQNNDYNEKEIIMQGGINPVQKIVRENADMLLNLAENILTSQRVTPGLVLEAIKDNILPSDETQGLPDLLGPKEEERKIDLPDLESSDAIISDALKTAIINLSDEQIHSDELSISDERKLANLKLRLINSNAPSDLNAENSTEHVEADGQLEKVVSANNVGGQEDGINKKDINATWKDLTTYKEEKVGKDGKVEVKIKTYKGFVEGQTPMSYLNSLPRTADGLPDIGRIEDPAIREFFIQIINEIGRNIIVVDGIIYCLNSELVDGLGLTDDDLKMMLLLYNKLNNDALELLKSLQQKEDGSADLSKGDPKLVNKFVPAINLVGEQIVYDEEFGQYKFVGEKLKKDWFGDIQVDKKTEYTKIFNLSQDDLKLLYETREALPQEQKGSFVKILNDLPKTEEGLPDLNQVADPTTAMYLRLNVLSLSEQITQNRDGNYSISDEARDRFNLTADDVKTIKILGDKQAKIEKSYNRKQTAIGVAQGAALVGAALLPAYLLGGSPTFAGVTLLGKRETEKDIDDQMSPNTLEVEGFDPLGKSPATHDQTVDSGNPTDGEKSPNTLEAEEFDPLGKSPATHDQTVDSGNPTDGEKSPNTLEAEEFDPLGKSPATVSELNSMASPVPQGQNVDSNRKTSATGDFTVDQLDQMFLEGQKEIQKSQPPANVVSHEKLPPTEQQLQDIYMSSKPDIDRLNQRKTQKAGSANATRTQTFKHIPNPDSPPVNKGIFGEEEHVNRATEELIKFGDNNANTNANFKISADNFENSMEIPDFRGNLNITPIEGQGTIPQAKVLPGVGDSNIRNTEKIDLRKRINNETSTANITQNMKPATQTAKNVQAKASNSAATLTNAKTTESLSQWVKEKVNKYVKQYNEAGAKRGEENRRKIKKIKKLENEEYLKKRFDTKSYTVANPEDIKKEFPDRGGASYPTFFRDRKKSDIKIKDMPSVDETKYQQDNQLKGTNWANPTESTSHLVKRKFNDVYNDVKSRVGDFKDKVFGTKKTSVSTTQANEKTTGGGNTNSTQNLTKINVAKEAIEQLPNDGGADKRFLTPKTEETTDSASGMVNLGVPKPANRFEKDSMKFGEHLEDSGTGSTNSDGAFESSRNFNMGDQKASSDLPTTFEKTTAFGNDSFTKGRSSNTAMNFSNQTMSRPQYGPNLPSTKPLALNEGEGTGTTLKDEVKKYFSDHPVVTATGATVGTGILAGAVVYGAKKAAKSAAQPSDVNNNQGGPGDNSSEESPVNVKALIDYLNTLSKIDINGTKLPDLTEVPGENLINLKEYIFDAGENIDYNDNEDIIIIDGTKFTNADKVSPEDLEMLENLHLLLWFSTPKCLVNGVVITDNVDEDGVPELGDDVNDFVKLGIAEVADKVTKENGTGKYIISESVWDYTDDQLSKYPGTVSCELSQDNIEKILAIRRKYNLNVDDFIKKADDEAPAPDGSGGPGGFGGGPDDHGGGGHGHGGGGGEEAQPAVPAPASEGEKEENANNNGVF